jgi:uncharacterized protein involved in type VI secretion and phage assembly
MYQKDNQSWAPWDTPIIMATWQAETGELWIWNQPGQNSETLISKKKKKDKTSKKERIKDDKGREESKEKSNKNFTKLKKSNTFIEKPIKYLRNEEIKWSNPRYDKGVSSLRG